MHAIDQPAPPPIRDPGRPNLADWLDLIALLEHDEGLPAGELRRRDRAIGARVEIGAAQSARWLTAWVRERRSEGGEDAPGVATAEAVRWATGILGLAGLVFGASAALGALSFQPQGRINVVGVLAVLVAAPAVLLLFALLNALPARLRRRLPLVGSEPEGGGLLQPARWVLRALPQRLRAALERVFGRGRALERLAAPIQRWGLLAASQGAAVAFQLGALVATLALVVFSDLSFGWSTTLRIEPEAAHRATTLLATPWAGLWPEAVPSSELIEQTRFFRIAARPAPDVAPELFGQWWRFVVAALVVYGLAPRLAFFVFARVRLRRGLDRAMVDAPGARRLLGRMRDPLVETAAGDDGDASGAPSDGAAGAERDGSVPWPEGAVVLSWAGAVARGPGNDADGPDALAPHGEAGGRLSPADDLAAAARAAEAARERDRPVAILVRGFEPPLLELLDFLAELRRQLGTGHEIVVGLVGAGPGDVATWRRRLTATGDPWLAWTSDVPFVPEDTGLAAAPAVGAHEGNGRG